jgi:membrane associated rhomboid family serine protease
MLRARTGRLIVTPLLVALNVLVFMRMILGDGALDDLQTLVGWGRQLRHPHHQRRMVAAARIDVRARRPVPPPHQHGRAGVARPAPRARGWDGFAFASIYLASGLLASVVSLWTTSPTSVSFGSSGAVFGIYGLLLASLGLGPHQPPGRGDSADRGEAARRGERLPFLLYNLLSGSLGTMSEMAGFAAAS